MRTYYELLNLPPKATPTQVQAVFQRFVARYRPTITIDQVFNDTNFRNYLNAYLTLHGKHRATYDELLAQTKELTSQVIPRPVDELTKRDRRLLLARLAFWRREMAEATHQLRSMLEDDPHDADGWALLGEVHLTVGRLREGIDAYTRAVQADQNNTLYAARLKHAQDAAAGRVELRIEASPEEELLREERLQRWKIMLAISIPGLALLIYACCMPVRHASLGFLNIPWRNILVQCLGAMILLTGLAYGHLIEPFERVMVWSSVAAGDRGSIKSYPVGLIMLALSVASLWLCVIASVVMAVMDDDWRASTFIMLGICVMANVCLALMLALGAHLPWGTQLIFGGNLTFVAAIFGWWAGSIGKSAYT